LFKEYYKEKDRKEFDQLCALHTVKDEELYTKRLFFGDQDTIPKFNKSGKYVVSGSTKPRDYGNH